MRWWCVVGALLLGLGACGRGGGGTGAGGVGGGGGAGGGSACPSEVAPLFTLRVAGPGGALPLDLILAVSWSAGEEPVVVLADPTSFGDASSNVICALVAHDLGEGGGDAGTSTATSAGGGGQGGGGDQEDLLCELWTSGPTLVAVEASGVVPLVETLVPATSEGCERPVPSEVTLELAPLEEEEEE